VPGGCEVALSLCVGLTTASRLGLPVFGYLIAMALSAIAILALVMLIGVIVRLGPFWQGRR